MSDKDATPVIGKHILSTLTIGMYQDPRMIYREYIQNSADQIDTLTEDQRQDKIRQTIVIDIDERNREVVITDQATGIPQKDFREKLLNVADSHKDPSKNKGFRGIGRLAGLNYCQKLIFESTAKGETVVSRLEMDGGALVKILHDTADRSLAGEVIQRISKVSCIENAAKDYDCRFSVILQDVRLDVGRQLLDVESVKEFIAQIAPVPFSNMKFKLGREISEEARKAGVRLEEYTVRVNGETITKLYKDVLNDAQGRELSAVGKPVYRLIDWHGKKLAWGWFILPMNGVSLPKSTNPERKIRLRKDNIQIGFDDFLDPYFPEARSNGYMLGEIHLLSDSILPNGDRNALEVSEEAVALRDRLEKVYFKDLWNAAHKANELNNAKKAIDAYRNDFAAVEKLALDGVGAGVEVKRPELDRAYEKALAGQQKLQKAAGATIRGDFVRDVVEAAVSDPQRKTVQLQPPEAVNRVRESEKPKVSSLDKVKTTGSRLMNVIVKVLSANGIETMQAYELAQKINEEISATA